MTSPRENLNVLVIDDDSSTVEVFSEFLEISDVKVVGQGYNGKEAVELYSQLKPDVVILDVMMPEYDGFYALENIRKINPNAIVVMITADLTIETEQRLKKLKVDSIVYKPFDIQQILEQLDKLALEAVKS